MLHFVQQFGGDWLQTRENRPKCCTKCNIEPRIRLIPPFLLYKIQHLLALPENCSGCAAHYLETSPELAANFRPFVAPAPPWAPP
nr:hypothetical protein [Paenibacillus ginsengihumi]